MPRIMQNADVYRNNDFRRVVKMQMAGRDMKQTDLARAMDLCPAAICKLLQNPEKLTVDKLRKVVKYLDIQPEDVIAFIGCKGKG